MTNETHRFGTLGVDTFYELVEHVCKRPTMYAARGTFFEIAAFLEGCAAGLYVADRRYIIEWIGFHRWLPERLHVPPNWAWAGCIMHSFPKDEDAIEHLPILFAEYLATETGRANE